MIVQKPNISCGTESNTNVEADKEEGPVEDVENEEAVESIDEILDTG